MLDTIDWLDSIGKDASLRHASAEQLAQTLEQGDASDALKASVLSGDSSLLSTEFGQKPMWVDHSTHTPGREEEDEPDDGEEGPGQPAAPEQSGSPVDR